MISYGLSSIFEGRKHPDSKEDDQMYQMGDFWDV